MVLDPPTSTYLVPHGVDADAVTSFLAQRLPDVLEERALLPLVLLRLEARSVRVLDEREKTVVRLGITSPLALGAADPAQAFTGGPIDAPDGGVPLTTRV